MDQMTRCFRLRPDVRFRTVAGEGVVLRQDSEKILVLNELGARVLEEVKVAKTVIEIADKLIQEYEVDRDALEADIVSYLNDLESRGVIVAQVDGEGL